MKKVDIKSVVLGLVIGLIGVTTVFAASGIKSAVFSNAKITLDGRAISLANSLISVTKDNEKDASLYMPVRELLEQLGYTVDWDGTHNTIHLFTSKSTNTTQISESNKKIYRNGLGEKSPMYDGDILYNLQTDNELSFELSNITTAVMKNGVMEKGSNLKLDIELVDPDGKTESKCTVSLDSPTAKFTAKRTGQYQLVVTNMQNFSVNFILTVVKN